MGQTQDIEIELAKLRKILHVPASINIRPSTSLLPNSEHIKVFIATGEDKKGYDVFVQKLDDWNKANALKYETIEVIQDIWQADVILARYDESLDKNPLSGTAPLYLQRSYAYILSRNPEGLQMLWRNVSEGYVDKSRSGEFGYRLRKELSKRLKTKTNK